MAKTLKGTQEPTVERAVLPKTILVVGAGTMGHSIAQVFAQAGITVHLADTNSKVLKRALDNIEANLSTMKEAEGFSESETATYIEAILPNVRPTEDLDGASDSAEFVFEAVYESVEIKQEVFDLLEGRISRDTVIASNTSVLDLFEEIQVLQPERLLCAHWFAPPHIVPLVEVVGGPATSAEALNMTVSLLRAVGKRPVVMHKFVPGFIANRIMMAMADAAEELIDSGASTPEDIDYAIKTSVGMRLGVVGIFQSLDFNGLDLIAGDRKLEDLPSYLRSKVEAGDLGIKTGRGFYEYDSQIQALRKRDLSYLAVLQALEATTDFDPVR